MSVFSGEKTLTLNECQIRITSAPTIFGWTAYYYSDWGKTPDSASTTTWTKNTFFGCSVCDMATDRAFRINTTGYGSAICYYEYVPGTVDYNATFEFKARVAAEEPTVANVVLDNYSNFRITANQQNAVFRLFGSGLYIGTFDKWVPLNGNDYHVYRINLRNNLTSSLRRYYVDNRIVYVGSTSLASATSSTSLIFGDYDSDNGINAITDIKMVRFMNQPYPYNLTIDNSPDLFNTEGSGITNVTTKYFMRNITIQTSIIRSKDIRTFATFEHTVKPLETHTVLTMSGDLSSLNWLRDLTPGRDYRIEIDALNADNGAMDSITCEGARISNAGWGLSDNDVGENAVTFDIYGMVY